MYICVRHNTVLMYVILNLILRHSTAYNIEKLHVTYKSNSKKICRTVLHTNSSTHVHFTLPHSIYYRLCAHQSRTEIEQILYSICIACITYTHAYTNGIMRGFCGLPPSPTSKCNLYCRRFGRFMWVHLTE